MRLGKHGWCSGDVEIVSLGHDALKNCFLHVLPFAIGSTSTWIQGLWCWMMCWQQFLSPFPGSLFQCLQLLSWVEHNVPSGSSKKAGTAEKPRNTTGRQRPGRFQNSPRDPPTNSERMNPPAGWLHPSYVGHLAHFQVEWPPWLTLTRSTDGRTHQIPDRSGGGVPACRRSNSHNANISHGRIDRNRWYKSFLTIYRCTVQFLSGMITHHSLKQPCPAISSPVFLRTKHPSSKGAAQFFIR